MSKQDQTIALAGVFQSIKLLQSVAHSGMVDMGYYQTCVQSILTLNADNTLDVYGGDIKNLNLGLRTLIDNFSGNDKGPKSMETTKYLINLMVLEKKLSKNDEMLNNVKRGIERAQSQREHFDLGDENIAKILAQTYKQTISNISPKIMVGGEHEHLNNPHHADRIRTLLLSAVRSIVLWHQRGGVRWKLVFERGALVKTARDLLS